jgi:hypothetical protein
MALDTYDNLKAAIADYLDRPDLTQQIPDFITLAEARHRRDIRTIDMLTRSQVTYSATGDQYVALPPRFLQMRLLRLLTDPVQELRAVTPNQITAARGASMNATKGMPTFYAVHEELEFNIVADKDYVVEMIYYASFPALSATNQVNALLTKNPDAYLYGSLIAAEPFMMHDDRIEVWAELYKTALDGIAATSRRQRQGSPIAARVYGGTP